MDEKTVSHLLNPNCYKINNFFQGLKKSQLENTGK